MPLCASELQLSGHDFRRLRDLIYRVAGIHLVDDKKTMVELRLRKRLVKLGYPSFTSYCDFLFGAGGDRELPSMIDLVTTNKTDFYREPAHFDYLTRVALPGLRAGFDRPLAVWSAGCSSGEEPYTLAMVLSDFAGQQESAFQFEILATDISGRMLEKARLGVYDMDAIAPIPGAARGKYLLKSRKPEDRAVRVAPEIRKRVEFRRLNLMDSDYRLQRAMDVIFCRNVVIYFDKPTQEQLIGRLAQNLRIGGYLFMGHSETLHGFDLPLAAVAPTVYRRQAQLI
jgi:chemotaxis protein methyltransferase CheR